MWVMLSNQHLKGWPSVSCSSSELYHKSSKPSRPYASMLHARYFFDPRSRKMNTNVFKNTIELTIRLTGTTLIGRTYNCNAVVKE